MNLFTAFPFVRYTLLLILGIVAQVYFPHYHLALWLVLVAFLGIFYALYSLRRKILSPIIRGIVGSFILILLGYLLTYTRTEENSPNHFSHQIKYLTHYQAVIESIVEEKPHSWKATAEVNEGIINGKRVAISGKILWYFDNQNISKPHYGDVFFVKGIPDAVEAPKNPEEFDYQQFLHFQNIDFQHYLREENIEKVGHQTPNWFTNLAIFSNTKADSLLTTFVGKKQEYGVANAMILGLRDDLDNDLVQAYSASGAIHVLSVSGLHVGVIFIVLAGMFGFLKKKGNIGKTSFVVIILGILWFYAFVTGLSSPVLRSTIMFSVITIAQTFQRDHNSYNTVAFSAFICLIISPFFVFNVGFQLSYLAVFGMIYFQPILNRLVDINKRKNVLYWLGDRLWKVSTVAVAAQIATLPITIYYFHQFPVYFLLANPVVILLSSIVLIGGLIFVILGGIFLLFDWENGISFLGKMLEYLTWILNESVLLTEKLPLSIINFIGIQSWEMWLLYFLIFSLICLSETRKTTWLYLSGIVLVVLISWNIYEKIQRPNQSILVLHSVNKHTVISVIAGSEATLLSDEEFLKSRKDLGYRLNNLWSKYGIRDTLKVNLSDTTISPKRPYSIAHFEVGEVLAWQGKTFLVIRESLKNKDLQIKNTSFDYLILANKSVKHLDEIMGKVNFKTLVIDGSYTKYYANQLAQESKILSLKYHDLGHEGGLVFEERE
jgi:competence protein ComEC